MSNKLVAFYLIGQFTDQWAENFFIPQMELLKTTGLYDQLEFIDIHVSGGKQPLPFIPDKIRKITYHTNKGQEENEMLTNMWEFANKNPGYKMFVFHSDGVTHVGGPMMEKKRAWRSYLEFCTIELWQQCVTLLDFYDCVGADYVWSSIYGNERQHRMRTPHYPGMFWWTHSNYLKKLDTDYFKQDVPWRRYLAELWIGTNEPRQYSMHKSGINCYETVLDFDRNEIKAGAETDIARFRELADSRYPEEFKK